ncbi:MAG: methyltransferase domain-containing protein [Burkholderiales bacterium]|nr:methyltransferase domain-containing protein [Burkholderiales bacterium]
MSGNTIKPAAQRYAAQQTGAQHPQVTIAEHLGVRTLHLSSEAIQGAMRLAMPEQIELEYVQQMMMWLLFREQAPHIVQLGLGAAALTKFCYRQFPAARVTAVELNPNVIEACRSHFKLPPDDARLRVMQMDAMQFVCDPANRASVDVMQIDLYDAAAAAPALSSPAFYQACAACLRDDGMLTVNLFGDPEHYAANCTANLEALEAAFDAVVWLPLVHDANTVAIAFKEAPAVDFEVLYARAAELRLSMKLPAAKWVQGLQEWMCDTQ